MVTMVRATSNLRSRIITNSLPLFENAIALKVVVPTVATAGMNPAEFAIENREYFALGQLGRTVRFPEREARSQKLVSEEEEWQR